MKGRIFFWPFINALIFALIFHVIKASLIFRKFSRDTEMHGSCTEKCSKHNTLSCNTYAYLCIHRCNGSITNTVHKPHTHTHITQRNLHKHDIGSVLDLLQRQVLFEQPRQCFDRLPVGLKLAFIVLDHESQIRVENLQWPYLLLMSIDHVEHAPTRLDKSRKPANQTVQIVDDLLHVVDDPFLVLDPGPLQFVRQISCSLVIGVPQPTNDV